MTQLIPRTKQKKDPLIRKTFNNQFWRKTLSEVCRQIDSKNIGLQVISPFGFEILENRNFFIKKFKTFLCIYRCAKASNLRKKNNCVLF